MLLIWWKPLMFSSRSYPTLCFPGIANILIWVCLLSFSLQYNITDVSSRIYYCFVSELCLQKFCVYYFSTCFAKHISKIHLWSCMWGYFIQFYCYKAFHWMTISQVIYLISCQWPFRYFQFFPPNYKQWWFEDLVFVPWGTGIRESLGCLPRSKICRVVGYMPLQLYIKPLSK